MSSLINRYRGLLAIILIASAVTAALNTSLGALLKWLAESVQGNGTQGMYTFVLLFAIQRLLLPISGGITTFSSNVLAVKLESDIRDAWYKHVIDLDSNSARQKNSGELQKKLQDAVSSVRSLLNNTLRSTLSIALEFISITAFTFFLIGSSASLALVLFGVVYSLHIIMVTRTRVPLIRHVAESDAACSAFMHDSFINSAPISSEALSVRSHKHALLLSRLAGTRINHAKNLLADSIWAAMLCGSMAYVGLSWFDGGNIGNVGTTIMLSTGFAQMISQINLLGFNYRNILHARIDIDRISAALAPVNPIANNSGERRIKILDRFHYEIHDLILFDYGGRQSLPLTGEITILKGHINTMSGESGVGKSTLARIMRGEITPSASKIFLCGTDMSHIDRDYLIQSISSTSQESIIFNESIRSNLLYGNPDATDCELIGTLSTVGLRKFSSSAGLDFIVGEKGGLLSGGERQRLAIARALLQTAELIILDEPFAGLDIESVMSLAKLISDLSHRVHVLLILHQNPCPLFDTLNTPLNSFILTENLDTKALKLVHEQELFPRD
ncbi:ABC transporter ATP-binding protein/permease [Burkholderia multivorans]|uniref:ATP-binding cassette domain-containing protein n=1 Tax=Burkholderia multivorans TaxID=87883 RepID=UPI00209D68E8|nr:ABC transporter ATP-binding protein [Burkholderia multivorans]MCO8610280.1 ABC transporter ATP-binding protein/permease [Burkholderia multivorans]MCO8637879.1 ABC transporter ATP-binding protein/permease [Burkholderia multivorans]MCO8648326.1 ABC transporter ATP-binding protein/permease [Burkholderia multivorans]